MELGAFSVSLAVKDIEASKALLGQHDLGSRRKLYWPGERQDCGSECKHPTPIRGSERRWALRAGGLEQLVLGTLFVIVLLRYRAMIPLMHVLIVAHYLATKGVAQRSRSCWLGPPERAPRPL